LQTLPARCKQLLNNASAKVEEAQEKTAKVSQELAIVAALATDKGSPLHRWQVRRLVCGPVHSDVVFPEARLWAAPEGSGPRAATDG
jgi:hypothetical protein